MEATLPETLSLLNCGSQFGIRERWDLEVKWPQLDAREERLLQQIRLRLLVSPVEVCASGVQVLVDHALPPLVAYLLLNDAYEHGDVRLVRKHLTSGDRCVVLGAGLGVVASAAAQVTGRPVLAFDADPTLEARVRDTARRNRVDIRFTNGAIVPGTEGGAVRFAVSEEFWSSAIGSARLTKCFIEAPAISLARACEAATAVIMDIEGAEVDVVREPFPGSVRTLLVEVHRPNLGSEASAKVVSDRRAKRAGTKDHMSATRVGRSASALS